MAAPRSKNAVLRYRRARHLVCYWTDDGPIVHNVATGSRGPGDPWVHRLLAVFDRWRTVDDLARAMPEHPPAALKKVVRALADLTFLQRSDEPARPADNALDEWGGWNPAASFFHCSTRDLKYSTDIEASGRRMRARARRVPLPSAVKRYSEAPETKLPSSQHDGEFARVVQTRRTWRQFSSRPVALEALADVLRLTFGVQRWVELPGIGRVALKSSPSGGARHPIECYVLAVRVAGLEKGLYHYRPDTHSLEQLSRDVTATRIKKYLPGQPWYAGASALIVMTAVFARTRWRYPFARAYRVVLAESGHLCQTFCLAASWRGLAPFCTMAIAESAIEADLGIDGIAEAALYAAGFGTRPDGVEWAPWPSRTRRARARSTKSRSGSARSQNRRSSS